MQQGSLIRSNRKRGPAVWQFRWADRSPHDSHSSSGQRSVFRNWTPLQIIAAEASRTANCLKKVLNRRGMENANDNSNAGLDRGSVRFSLVRPDNCWAMLESLAVQFSGETPTR